jgi:outer membrane immunogenic protein
VQAFRATSANGNVTTTIVLDVIFVRIFLLFGFLLLTTNSALAQSAGVPFVSWSGPYAGLNAGYAGGHSDQTDRGFPASVAPAAGSATTTPAAASPTAPSYFFDGAGGTITLSNSHSSRPIIGGSPIVITETGDGHYSVGGGLIGGTLGYNWQRGRWVFGIEGDYAWADVAGHSSACGSNPHPCGTSLDSLGTFRGRIGYAAGSTGSLLPYLTGGAAFGNVRGWDSLMSASGTSLRTGWTAGAGIEAMITPQWTAKLEYFHADFGGSQLFDIVPGIPETVDLRLDSARIGLNYRFDAAALRPQ